MRHKADYRSVSISQREARQSEMEDYPGSGLSASYDHRSQRSVSATGRRVTGPNLPIG